MKDKNLVNHLIISVVLTIFVVLTFVCYWFMPLIVYKPAKQSSLNINKSESIITTNSNSIKILQLTDFHINGALGMPITFSMIKRLIYKTKPDLLYLSGDLFSNGASKKDVDTFLNFIESFKLPWAAVFGNHDDETPYTMLELSTKFENANYSLFKTGNLTNLYGNYYYNINFEDNNRFEFIFMDSRSRGFTEESVDFYEHAVKHSKNLNNNQPSNNILFYHIPLAEEIIAVAEYKNNPKIGEGKINEEVCAQENQVGFFNKVLELGVTKAMLFGHDHVNNAKIKYNDVMFCYGTKTGSSSYNKISIQGGTLYTLSSSGELSYKDVYLI
ncbi:MAG: metallophosphoesterase [Clostridia bacterium]|nr:metallophosphoesterase [Clostridia bacterium]